MRPILCHSWAQLATGRQRLLGTATAPVDLEPSKPQALPLFEKGPPATLTPSTPVVAACVLRAATMASLRAFALPLPGSDGRT